MLWRIDALSGTDAARLEAIGRAGAVEGEATWFRSLDRGRLRVRCLILGGVLAAGMGWLAVEVGSQVPLAAALLGVGAFGSALWAAMLLREHLAVRGGRIPPFLLLTPRCLLRVAGDGRRLEGWRLTEAKRQQAVSIYTSGDDQRYAGRRYEFDFPGTRVLFVVRSEEETQRVEAVLELARAGRGMEGEELLPATPGAEGKGPGRGVADPFGEFWLGVLGIALIVVIVLVVLARILG